MKKGILGFLVLLCIIAAHPSAYGAVSVAPAQTIDLGNISNPGGYIQTVHQKTTPNPNALPKPKGVGIKNAAVGVLGAAAGAYGVYESASGQGEHGLMNVAGGTASGAIMGASIGSIVPGLGTALGAGLGAVVGGVVSGSQLFSETDCLHDPITNQFTCCNTVFNQGERQVPIGGYMFCGKDGMAMPPGVRQCLQGGQAQAASWWDGLWQDDEWEKECRPRWCAGQSEPVSGTDGAAIVWLPDVENFCWKWDCNQEQGYVREGNTCRPTSSPQQPNANNSAGAVLPGTVAAENPYDRLIQRVQQLRQQLQQECGIGAGL